MAFLRFPRINDRNPSRLSDLIGKLLIYKNNLKFT
jgi:hypothetical protein